MLQFLSQEGPSFTENHQLYQLYDNLFVLNFCQFQTVSYYLMLTVQGSATGWPTGNGKKLSKSHAYCLAHLCLAAA